MMLQPDYDRSQLEKLDKETLIAIILTLQQIVDEQAVVIQFLRDQLAPTGS